MLELNWLIHDEYSGNRFNHNNKLSQNENIKFLLRHSAITIAL